MGPTGMTGEVLRSDCQTLTFSNGKILPRAQNFHCSVPIILDSRVNIYSRTQAADVTRGILFAADPLTLNLTSTL